MRALTVYQGELVAGGYFAKAGDVLVNSIARWNGSGRIGKLSRRVTTYNGELIVGGEYATAGGVSASSIARWNGTAWQLMGAGIQSKSSVYALAVYNEDLIAGGDFVTAGDNVSAFWARWGLNGTSEVAANLGGDCDVDAHDFTLFSGCATGPGILYGPGLTVGCELALDGSGHVRADFDVDGDVDQGDFGLFQRCYSGSGIAADAACGL